MTHTNPENTRTLNREFKCEEFEEVQKFCSNARGKITDFLLLQLMGPRIPVMWGQTQKVNQPFGVIT